MRVIIEFDLPEDKPDFIITTHAMDWALTAYDMDNKLREWLKYGYVFDSVEEALKAVKSHLCDVMSERDISLDMIE